MKPAAAIPAATGEVNPKSGTTIVKSAPPKETSRITVKPNQPTAAPRVSNIPTAKPAAGAVPVVAAAAAGAVAGVVAAKAAAPKPSVGAKPATTIVKSGTAKVVAAPKPVASATVPVPAMPESYQEKGSTTLTTLLAGGLAVLTWGTAGVLFASYLGYI
jgi:hypothetical protein